jgi:hypothetical protein
MTIERGSPHHAAVQRERLSALCGQTHSAATRLKENAAGLKDVDWPQVERDQFDAMLHAARRAGVHAHAMLDRLQAIQKETYGD